MTREQLGEIVGLDKEAIGRIERGERMNFDNLEPISLALHVSVRDLFVTDEPLVYAPNYPLPLEVLKVAYMIERRSAADPTYLRRVQKILKNI